MQQLPLFLPDSDWQPPAELPDIRGQVVALDSETRDDSLSADRGPGWPYRAGRVVGVSAAWAGGALYTPVAHPDSPENMDHGAVGRWVDHICRHNTVVFQNGPYDMGWFGTEWGTTTPASYHDTQLEAVMLDENRLSYRLDAICRWLGVPGKDETKLREAAAVFGVDPKKELWKLPARFVGPYATQDAVSTLSCHHQMQPMLEAQSVRAAYELDRDLIPMVVAMRRRGIRVDTGRAQQLERRFLDARDAELAEISRRLPIGRRVTINDIQSPRFLEQVHDMEGIQFPRTVKTRQGSFTMDWMKKHPHWLPQAIVRATQHQEMAHKFLRGFVLDYSHRGRIHSEVHLYRSDDGGTRSYRFSYSDPPLQQMPSRTEEGRLIRTCFLPEDGELWDACDYSQQEYRLIVHYAYLCRQRRAEEAVARYREDPDTDFHQMVADLTGLPRRRAKDVNFAKAFGAGVKKFAAMIEQPESVAKQLYEQYDREMPFVSGAAQVAASTAAQRGYITLLDNARCRFDQWELSWREEGEAWSPPGTLQQMRERHPGRRLRRAFTHKSFNRLIQGGAARQTKLAMRECWREGIVPLIQMHDELGSSVGSDYTVQRIKEIMEGVVTLEVPVVAEPKLGLSWGDAAVRPAGIVGRLRRRIAARAPAIVASAFPGEGATPLALS